MEFDLHIHSRYSFDSLLSPKKIVEIALSRGLSGIAVTDNHTIKGAKEAKLYAPTGFMVILGAEIDVEGCQLLGLFLKEEVSSKDPKAIAKEIKQQGGIMVLAHPGKENRYPPQEILDLIDAVEGFNARLRNFGNIDANKIAHEISQVKQLPMIAGSDAHFGFEIGRGKLLVDNISSEQELKERILAGKASIVGQSSSYYLDGLSKFVKAIKLRRPRTFLGAFYHLAKTGIELSKGRERKKEGGTCLK